VAPLETAEPEQISFVIDARYRAAAAASRAGAFLVSKDVSGLRGPLLRSDVPTQALIALLTVFHPAAPARPGVDPTAIVARDARVDPSAAIGALAVIGSGAVIGPNVSVHPLTYVGPGVEVGEGCVLHPRVVLCEGVHLGRRVIVHPGAVIGGDGFGDAFDGNAHPKIPQVGGVVIEDDVEIGANTTVDRATLGATVIGHGTKIDNLVMVGHGCRIGPDCLIAAQVGLAGSTTLGARVMLGGQVGSAGHLTVGDGARVAAQSGVHRDVPPRHDYAGYPAVQAREWRRASACMPRLPALFRRMRRVERAVGVGSAEDAPGDEG